MSRSRLCALASLLLALACGGGEQAAETTGRPGSPCGSGEPDHLAEAPVGAGGMTGRLFAGSGGTGGSGGSSSGGGSGGAAGIFTPPPPQPLVPVGEGDIFRIDGSRLLHLNSHRGFFIYDLADPKQPRRLARLPLFGDPTEMFVTGQTVHALVRDVFSYAQQGDQFQFRRRSVSQLITIDISDPAKPRVTSTRDIPGQLHEGAARKVQNIIYTVSQVAPATFPNWWLYPDRVTEEAWVHAFDVSDANQPQEKARHQLFRGGAVYEIDQAAGSHTGRLFSGLTVSAAPGALLVVQNWREQSFTGNKSPPGPDGCSQLRFRQDQQSVVAVIDIRDPASPLVEQRFQTAGILDQPFKMAYIPDPATGGGTFHGIFNRTAMSGQGCQSDYSYGNTLESWLLNPGSPPVKLDALAFGPARDQVQASIFDLEQKVVYASTTGHEGLGLGGGLRHHDTLHALSIADPADLTVRSTLDGVASGMSVFQLVGVGRFLFAAGRNDRPEICPIPNDGSKKFTTQAAVSLIDVRDPTAMKVTERRCLAMDGAAWSDSAVSSNGDVLNWSLRLHNDGALNVLSAPIYYQWREEPPHQDQGSARLGTAIGLAAWDLTSYDPASAPRELRLDTPGTFVHPHGEVRRSVLYRHPGTGGGPPRRMMLNASDTHLSLVDIEDLRQPQLQSTMELAPYYKQIHRFGDHLVEQVAWTGPRAWPSSLPEPTQFHVRRAGEELDDGPPLAQFAAPGLQRVFQHRNSLVLFVRDRQVQSSGIAVQVMDLRDPARPRAASRMPLPAALEQTSLYTLTSQGMVLHIADRPSWGASNRLVFLDLQDPDALTISEQPIPGTADITAYGLAPDPIDPRGFYLSSRKLVGTITRPDGQMVDQFRYFAQRWQPVGGRWMASAEINIPGHLIATWQAAGGDRMFLAQGSEYRRWANPADGWAVDTRLSLLRQVQPAGCPATAQLLDSRLFRDLQLSSLVREGDRVVFIARPIMDPGDFEKPRPGWEQTSDRLVVLQTATARLDVAHDQPTRLYQLSLTDGHPGKLFLNVGRGLDAPARARGSGDGVLVFTLDDPLRPRPTRFVRTLGDASPVQVLDDQAFVAAGHLGVLRLDLRAPADLPKE